MSFILQVIKIYLGVGFVIGVTDAIRFLSQTFAQRTKIETLFENEYNKNPAKYNNSKEEIEIKPYIIPTIFFLAILAVIVSCFMWPIRLAEGKSMEWNLNSKEDE